MVFTNSIVYGVCNGFSMMGMKGTFRNFTRKGV